jgi:phage terminase large subunit-like protein
MTMIAKVERRLKAFTRHLPPPRPKQDDRPHPRDLWLGTARPEQIPPPGDWLTWLILAGRGWGKSRTGAETIADWARHTPGGRWALVAQSAADGRDVMLEGESGLLRVLAPSELRGGTYDTAYNRSLGELHLSDGGKFKLYTAEKPRQLRGPQHHGAWLDEPATFADADKGAGEDTTWTNMLFGLRLGQQPRIVVTGTPRPVRLVRDIMAAPNTVITRGSTYDNLANLAPTFREAILKRYEGTRLGRQELDGELLEDTPGALWKYSMFGVEGFRLVTAPPLVRIVVAIDPAASSTDESDETGIIAAGLGMDGRGYVLADATLKAGPTEWAKAAVGLYGSLQADRIVAERNNGGDMVEAVLRSVAPHVPVTTVWASRGKQTRAEPVAALYEQGRVSHIGVLKDLESQMTTWMPGEGKSPDRMDALVWALTELMLQPELEPTIVTTTRRRSVVQ